MDNEQTSLSKKISSTTMQSNAANKAGQAGWAVEIIAHNGTSASNGQDLPVLSSLPALLGLDTLSLSLPNSGAAGNRPAKSTRTTGATATSSISRIRIQGIPTDHVHLLFSSPALDTGIRSGLWIRVPLTASGITLRFRWDRDSEELEPYIEDEISGNETPEASVKIFNYDELLDAKSGASVSASSVQDEWPILTRFVTPTELDRLIPTHNVDTNGIQTWPVSTLSTSTTKSDLTAAPAQQADIYFTPITLKNTFPPSSIGRDRTKHSLDKSWYLSSILPSDTPSSPDAIYGSTLLAEFALSFLLASTLGNGSASQHWKDILRVSLRCTSAVTSSTTYTFFVALLQFLEAQLRYLDLFPSSEIPESQEQRAGQNPSANAGNQASLLFESEDDLAALYELLLAFGRKNLANTMAPTTDNEQAPTPASESDSPRAAVRKAYLSLASSTTTTSTSATTIPLSSWDLASALASTSADDEDDKQQRRLQRRFLRGMEGFGYGSGSGLGYAEAENGITDIVNGDNNEDEEDEDEDAPVVLDLDGLLAEAHEDGVDEDGGLVERKEVDEARSEYDDELEDEELDDLRY